MTASLCLNVSYCMLKMVLISPNVEKIHHNIWINLISVTSKSRLLWGKNVFCVCAHVPMATNTKTRSAGQDPQKQMKGGRFTQGNFKRTDVLGELLSCAKQLSWGVGRTLNLVWLNYLLRERQAKFSKPLVAKIFAFCHRLHIGRNSPSFSMSGTFGEISVLSFEPTCFWILQVFQWTLISYYGLHPKYCSFFSQEFFP